jgi:hypothetical protein
MKQVARVLLWIALASSAAWSQSQSGTITGTSCFSIDTHGKGVVGISITNTPTGSAWSGTIQPQVSIEGDPYQNVQVTPSTSSTAQSTITANGVYTAGVSGTSTFQVCGNTVTNTAQVKLQAVQLSAKGASGGGSGTVTNTGGALTANAVVLGAGGNDTKVSTGITTNGAAELDVGVSGTNGVFGLNGSTSGKATFTAPAVAGTSTNAVVMTNVLTSPNGLATAPAYGDGGGDGVYFGSVAGSNGTILAAASTPQFGVSNGSTFGINAPSGSAYGWTSGVIGAAGDTNLNRLAAGVVQVGTTALNGLGAFTNCRTVVNVTPVTVSANVTTDQNLMAFTLPANCLNTVGRTLRVFAAGVYTTPAASAATITVELKICSVSGCASGNVADVIDITSSANPGTVTNNAWNLTAWVTTQTASTTGAWESHGVMGIDLGALNTSADSFFNDTNTATVTGTPSNIDTTAQNFLQVSIAFSTASASNAATQRQLVIDSVN